MVSKELIDFVNNELPLNQEWWDEDNATAFHKACGTFLSLGMNVENIKQLLTELYTSVVNEFGN